MKITRFLFVVLWTVISIIGVIAQDEATEDELPVVPYFQSSAFNAPVLDGWENQSTDEVAQFYLADAQATIRTAVVNVNDSVVGAQQDLEAFLDTTLDAPMYSEKVNLADGTWAVLVYQVDEVTTASAMARQNEGRTFVVSFIESHPDAQVYMTTIAHNDESDANNPILEMGTAVEAFTSVSANDLSDPETITLPSGEWTQQTNETVSVLGWIFGNDSYLALADGAIDDLPELANAYNTTLLGFFITPDNGFYLMLGLVVSLGTLAILLLSIILRARGLEKDLTVIQQLAQDD
jgi:hypothetical protein